MTIQTLNHTRILRRFATPLAGLLVFSVLAATPQQAVAADRATERPIADFVNAQGTFDFGFLFVPPVPNFLGWTDSASGLSLSIDYAGLADKACHGVAGTKYTGKVKEKRLADGRAEVTVELLTLDAITWVVNGFDFANDPVIFGVRWRDDGGDCVMDASPALGNSMLTVTFINTSPGAPLPDLIQVFAEPKPGQEVLALSIRATAIGTLPDGRWARAETHQHAKLKDGELSFDVETISVKPLPSKASSD